MVQQLHVAIHYGERCRNLFGDGDISRLFCDVFAGGGDRFPFGVHTFDQRLRSSYLLSGRKCDLDLQRLCRKYMVQRCYNQFHHRYRVWKLQGIRDKRLLYSHFQLENRHGESLACDSDNQSGRTCQLLPGRNRDIVFECIFRKHMV